MFEREPRSLIQPSPVIFCHELQIEVPDHLCEYQFRLCIKEPRFMMFSGVIRKQPGNLLSANAITWANREWSEH